MDYDVRFVLPGPINFCSWNKAFKFNNNLLKSLNILFYFLSDSVNSVKFWLCYIDIQTVLDITFDSHSSSDSFFFTSKPLNLRNTRCLFCYRSSIFHDFNSPWDLRYASFLSKLVILLFNFSMDASLAFNFSSNVDIFQ